MIESLQLNRSGIIILPALFLFTYCQTNKEATEETAFEIKEDRQSTKILNVSTNQDSSFDWLQAKEKEGWYFDLSSGEVIDKRDERIILDKSIVNHPRYWSIYRKLASGKSTISGYLKKFDSDISAGHIKLSVDNDFHTNVPEAYWNSLGITRSPHPRSRVIEVIFNNGDSLMCIGSARRYPKIVLAGALLHEMIHADMYRKLISYPKSPFIDALTQRELEQYRVDLMNDFPGLWDFYLRYKWKEEAKSSNPHERSPQHELMAARYVNTIATALAEYDMNRHEEQFYHDLSWTGLLETVSWNNLEDEEQERIRSVILRAYETEFFDD